MKPIVQLTKDSALRGRIVYARDSKIGICAFRGIPYASPPVGHLRFKPTQPLELWKGLRDCKDYGPICPQDMKQSASIHFPYPVPDKASEDCLYLNVYTPSLEKTLPVMVWIHGGSLLTGFGDFYEGTALALYQNVVFVSINYRLGPLGFLSTGDDQCPGNAGIWDQIESLRWVKKYIHKFGGDPENVTVFGESAGGISIGALLITPHAANLFKRAILQSGTSLYPSCIWPPQNAATFLKKRLHNMGCTHTSSKEIMEFLRRLPLEEIMKHLENIQTIIMDGDLIQESALHAYKKGKFNPVDIMIGFNSCEGAQFIFSRLGAKCLPSEDKMEQIIDTIVKKEVFRGNLKQEKIKELLKQEYVENDTGLEEKTKGLIELYGDTLFVAPSIQHALLHSERGNTYVYRFNHRPGFSPYPEWVKADHGHEIPFVLGDVFLEKFPDVWTEEEKEFSKKLMAYWTSFAKSGNPNTRGLTKWPKFNKGSEELLELTTTPEVISKHSPQRMTLHNVVINELAEGKSKY